MSSFIGVLLIFVGIILPIVMIATANARPRRQQPRSLSRQKQERFASHPRYPELVMLLNGDHRAADRLSKAYGVDRAISDLIRDRR